MNQPEDNKISPRHDSMKFDLVRNRMKVIGLWRGAELKVLLFRVNKIFLDHSLGPKIQR